MSYEEDENPRLDIEELFETKQKTDFNRLQVFNKLLKKIHSKIKTQSRQRDNNEFIWFLMPEILVGYPNYNFSECLVFIMGKLNEDGFVVRYTHPNLLFICWKHWVPQYVRDEMKKKTGENVDCYGNIIESKKTEKIFNESNKLESFFNKKNNSKTETKPINDYKSSGKFIYDESLFSSMKKHLSD